MPRENCNRTTRTSKPGEWKPPVVGAHFAETDACVQSRAAKLARELGLPLVNDADSQCDLLLVVAESGLELRDTDSGGARGVRIEFGETPAGARRLATASRRQPLARAIGLRKRTPTVFDATAGMGRDAIMLASLGCRVAAFERSTVLGAMLRDALERAAATGAITTDTARLITISVGDATEHLSQMSDRNAPDVVYLDPMYPQGGKSALPKKELRILRKLVGDDLDAAELLAIARRAARERVVVKRAPHAPPLGPEPSMCIRGKLVRYDVYLRTAGSSAKPA